MSGSQLQVRLYRDSFNTPWGFRLQGGKDLGQPLSIQRVFSNSPAEGELQRGDLILSINDRNANELTHKQAQDCIKFGGGQIMLVINRPGPGRVQTTVTIKPQHPRAPSLQIYQMRDHETPATGAFIRHHFDRMQRLVDRESSNLSPTSPAMSSGGREWSHDPCYNPNFSPQLFSPISPLNPPHWAAQSFAPKKVSKLSRLGGGGMDFGVDYRTVPRRRHSTQISSSMPHLATGEPPKVTRLSRLGGGGFDFGVDYCTLPRKKQRQLSQPPPQSPKTQMPSGGSYAFQPKKVNLSKLGGGGPEFGSDYTAYRPSYTQPVTIQTSAVQRGQQHAEMLNRVQESLDNITLSPRTPDQYQQPPFTSPSSQYIPTGVRIDMEREQELRNKELQQQQQRYQQQQVQQQQVQQQQVQQQQQQQQYQFSPQPAYTPTGVRLDQQGQGEEEEEFVPVWERRRAFMNVPSQPSAVPSSKGAPKKIPRSQPGSAAQSFGIDYSKPQPRTTTVTWKPQPVTTPSQETPPPSWKRTEDEPSSAPPAWRETLKSSGVKPWDADLEYSPQLKQAPRSVPFQPLVDKHTFASPQTHTEDGPQVVHLQYNTPIGLYSNENVKETFAGQTQALAAGGPSPGGAPQQGQNPPKPGDRDWTQSAVYRMIHEEERRGRPGPKQQPPTPQQPQQQRGFVPAPPPKPQQAFQQPIKPLDDEYGTSDF